MRSPVNPGISNDVAVSEIMLPRLITNHGGHVDVESVRGRSSTFTVPARFRAGAGEMGAPKHAFAEGALAPEICSGEIDDLIRPSAQHVVQLFQISRSRLSEFALLLDKLAALSCTEQRRKEELCSQKLEALGMLAVPSRRSVQPNRRYKS
jgi:hypothetical protein